MGECVADGNADDTAEEVIEDDDDGVYGVLTCIIAADEDEDGCAPNSYCWEANEGEVAWEEVEATGEACIEGEAIEAGVYTPEDDEEEAEAEERVGDGECLYV